MGLAEMFVGSMKDGCLFNLCVELAFRFENESLFIFFRDERTAACHSSFYHACSSNWSQTLNGALRVGNKNASKNCIFLVVDWIVPLMLLLLVPNCYQ